MNKEVYGGMSKELLRKSVGKRIKNIRSELKMDQAKFAKCVGATVSALSNWENGRNKPNYIKALEIAKLGNITVEELLEEQAIVKANLGEKIRGIRLNLGLTTEQFSEKIGVSCSKGTVSKWENGIYLPNPERLKQIADLANITVSELLNEQQSTKVFIGHKIKDIRVSKRMSMEDFGKLLNPPASRGLVSNWENNYNYPNQSRLKQIAKIGNTTVNQLLHSDILQQFSIEELEAEVKRRKSPHGNAD